MALHELSNEELAWRALSLYRGKIRPYPSRTGPKDEEPASDNTAIGFVRQHKSEMVSWFAETEYWTT